MNAEQQFGGVLTFTATALDPIHHGAGSEGNTQLLRTQDIMLEDGTPARVPFVSGNSFKHQIRDGGVKFALEVMGIPAGSLTKPVIDLLFSGGALTKSGNAVNLAQARDLATLFPILAVCGYAAGNFMQASKIRVGHLHLVCSENRWRMPEGLIGEPHTAQRAAAFRGEEFGTRHEPTRSQHVFKLLTPGDKKERLKALSGDAPKSKAQRSQQMLYDFEVVRPGSRWFSDIVFDDLTEMELVAMRSALERACTGRHGEALVFHVGAKSSVGMGRMAFVFDGGLRETLSPPSFSPAEAITPLNDDADTDAMAAYINHLRENKDSIVEVLNSVV